MSHESGCSTEPCPKCTSGHVVYAYGLGGGGCGAYRFCDSDACDFFEKDSPTEDEC